MFGWVTICLCECDAFWVSVRLCLGEWQCACVSVTLFGECDDILVCDAVFGWVWLYACVSVTLSGWVWRCVRVSVTICLCKCDAVWVWRYVCVCECDTPNTVRGLFTLKLLALASFATSANTGRHCFISSSSTRLLWDLKSGIKYLPSLRS